MPQLDGLRAFAVFGVMAHHWIPSVHDAGFRLGPAGVQLFFILSGFLITGILLRCKSAGNTPFALKAFYIRRSLRIFPLYYLVLLILYARNIQQIRASIGWHALYLSNFYFFLEGHWQGSMSHFWTLAVEEQFYLFWPIMVLLTPMRYLSRTVLLLGMVGILSRLGFPVLFPDLPLYHVLPTTNFDSLGMGALLACVSHGGRSKAIEKLLAYFPLSLIAFGMLLALRIGGLKPLLQEELEQFSLLFVGAWLVDRAAKGFGGAAGAVLENRLAMYLGKVSYGLYVLHNFASIPVSALARRTGLSLLENEWIRVALMLLLTIGGASLSWYALERPLSALKDRFPYRRRSSKRRHVRSINDKNPKRSTTEASFDLSSNDRE